MIPPAIDARVALQNGAADLLMLSGAAELAALVRAGTVELGAERETWEMGDRIVEAQRIALFVDAASFVALHDRSDALARVRDAFAVAVRSFETELLELGVFLRLEPGLRSWQAAYRSVPTWSPPAPSASAVGAGAAALARASGDARVTAMLEHAVLEVSAVGDPGESLTRWLVRLSPEELIEADRDANLRAKLELWVRYAAASARGRVGDIELGVRLATR